MGNFSGMLGYYLSEIWISMCNLGYWDTGLSKVNRGSWPCSNSCMSVSCRMESPAMLATVYTRNTLTSCTLITTALNRVLRSTHKNLSPLPTTCCESWCHSYFQNVSWLLTTSCGRPDAHLSQHIHNMLWRSVVVVGQLCVDLSTLSDPVHIKHWVPEISQKPVRMTKFWRVRIVKWTTLRWDATVCQAKNEEI